MSGSGMRISANYDRWIRGFGNLGTETAEQGEQAWKMAAEVFFDHSQEYAHVLSGDMKRSGSLDVGIEQGDLTAEVAYDSEHAFFEELRGGEHAFLTRAWEATESTFAEAFAGSWESVVESWR